MRTVISIGKTVAALCLLASTHVAAKEIVVSQVAAFTGAQASSGKAIRAGIEDVDHVEGLGIDVYRLFTITFVIAGTLSGLAGGLNAPLIMVDPTMGLEVIALVFMVVIIGGLGSIKGTAISALIVGQVMSIGSLVYAPLAQMAPFAMMLLILLIKPTGLYGSPLLKR